MTRTEHNIAIRLANPRPSDLATATEWAAERFPGANAPELKRRARDLLREVIANDVETSADMRAVGA